MNNQGYDLQSLKNSFVEDLKEKGRSSSTILAYGNDISQLIEFLVRRNKDDIKEVKTEDIEAYKQFLQEKKYTDKSVSRKLNSIKGFFRFLIGSGIRDDNPAADIAHPKITHKKPRILSKMEYRALRDVCRDNKRIYAIVELFLQTGIRISELSRLNLDDIKEDKIIIRAHESHSQREVPLNSVAKGALEDYLKVRKKTRSKALFVTKNGHRFLVRNIRSAINRRFKLAELHDVTVNDLRHTFIAHQLKAGTPLVVISQLVGHKRLSTTEKYLEYIKQDAESSEVKVKTL